MNLGLGLTAVDQYFKADDARVLREQQREKFGWDKARAESELSVLPDKTEADREDFRDRRELAAARRRLRPAETDLSAARTASAIETQPIEAETAMARAKTGRGAAQFELEQQPTTQATTSLQNQTGLANASAAFLRQPDEAQAKADDAKVAAALSQHKVQDLPRVIGDLIRNGAISEAQAQTQVAATMGQLAQTGDAGGLVQFFNDMSKVRANGQQAPQATAVRVDNHPQAGKVLVFTGADGNPVTSANGQPMIIPMSALERAQALTKKTEWKAVNAGDTLVGLQNGNIVSQYTAPESAKSTTAKAGPLERDANFLATTLGIPVADAVQRLNSAKTKSREQFVLNMYEEYGKNNFGKKPSQAEIDEWGRIYDGVRKGGAGATPPPAAPASAPSNTKPAGTISPDISRLIGIPSQ